MKNINTIIKQNMEYGIWNMELIYSKFKILNSKFQTKGFTLIELMVVIAIIGVLATIISAPIQTYLKKSRDAKRIADMSQIKDALGQYAVDHNGYYPTDISLLTPDYLKTLPLNVASSTAGKDKYMYVTYTNTGNVVSYHLGVALEFQNTAIQGIDADCGSLANPCNSNAVNFTNIGTTATYVSNTGTTPSATTDFDGADIGQTSSLACVPTSNGISNCVYDITP